MTSRQRCSGSECGEEGPLQSSAVTLGIGVTLTPARGRRRAAPLSQAVCDCFWILLFVFSLGGPTPSEAVGGRPLTQRSRTLGPVHKADNRRSPRLLVLRAATTSRAAALAHAKNEKNGAPPVFEVRGGGRPEVGGMERTCAQGGHPRSLTCPGRRGQSKTRDKRAADSS